MKALLQKAITINRRLVQEATVHSFKIANSHLEEEDVLKSLDATERTTILRLYERELHKDGEK